MQRPSDLPRRIPTLTPSAIRPRSNSAIAPKMCICSLPGRRRGVDTLCQADERHAERLQLVEQRDQVLQVPPYPARTSKD
jgi:hypothetical protein